MRIRLSWMVGLCLHAAVVWAGESNVLRFEQASYEVADGTTFLTATIVYDLDAGVVGDNFFDLDVGVAAGFAGASITITNVERSTPYLYSGSLDGGGVFNMPSSEFALEQGGLQLLANQGALAPISDMNLPAGVYGYADVTMSITGSVGTVFDLTFSNIGLHDEAINLRPLEAVNAQIAIVPEPSTVCLLLLGGATILRRR